MNNKGFAITTIIFGLLMLFMFLLVSFMGMSAMCKNNLSKLINETGGARDIIKVEPITEYNSMEDLLRSEDLIKSGLYCFSDGCKYISQYNFK